MKTIQKKQRGFTLVELLVVIAIIGLLATTTYVYLGPVMGRGRDTQRVSDIRGIGLLMETGKDSSGGYKTLVFDVTTKVMTTTLLLEETLPTDPGGGTAASCISGTGEMLKGTRYCGFTNAAGGTTYCVYARLASGNFIVSSTKGVRELTAAPTSLVNCN